MPIGAFLRMLEARFPQRQATAQKRRTGPEASIQKPASLVGAEDDLFRLEMCHRIRMILCRAPHRCDDSRCRRARRCFDAAGLDDLLSRARAKLAAERAKHDGA